MNSKEIKIAKNIIEEFFLEKLRNIKINYSEKADFIKIENLRSYFSEFNSYETDLDQKENLGYLIKNNELPSLGNLLVLTNQRAKKLKDLLNILKYKVLPKFKEKYTRIDLLCHWDPTKELNLISIGLYVNLKGKKNTSSIPAEFILSQDFRIRSEVKDLISKYGSEYIVEIEEKDEAGNKPSSFKVSPKPLHGISSYIQSYKKPEVVKDKNVSPEANKIIESILKRQKLG